MAIRFNAATVNAASTGFRGAFLKALALNFYGDVTLRVSSSSLIESYQVPEMLGPLMVSKGELVVEVPIRFSKDVTNRVYEKAIGVPLDDIHDDRLGLYRAQIDGLAVAAKSHGDILLADTLKAGFTTAKSYDNVAMFSASHPKDGGTQSNLQSGALSSTTFGQAEAKLDTITDWYGNPLRLGRFSGGKKRKLIVGPSNRATAKSIVEIATTASGAGNPYYGSAEVQVEEALQGDYAGYWFLAQAGGIAPPLLLQVREEPDVTIIDGKDTYEVTHHNRILVKARTRMAAAPLFWQGIVGSTGS